MNVEVTLGGEGELRCVVATIAISEVRAGLEAHRERHFSEREAAELLTKHPRTTAGFLATKQALCELYATASPQQRVSTKDFVLGHDERGAPRLLERPRLEVEGSRQGPWISISHTRDHAYGLAVMHEPGCGHD